MSRQGQQISHYRLSEKIGQGGMGEVWKAVDLRLDREVAIKFLPEVVTHDPERLERFSREAKFLAALNHPGIATIHDVDEHEGVRFLVMELVPGQDLAERLESGPLPLDQALDVALQVARAIEAAHGQGVVHRDLKPANVKRTPDGQIKVLDFGLAKVVAPESSSSSSSSVSMSPTMTSAGTVAGVILGTAAYMSPEQARGRPIDKRTDIWSFGVLIYELLTGDNPFRGDTVADSVGAIMHRNPDLDELPPETPSAVKRLLRRCVTRERGQRLHDIADVRIELEEAIANPEDERPVATVVAPESRTRLPWIALAVLVPLVALIAWWAGSRPEPSTPEPERRFKLVADQEVDELALSPDGSRLAYTVGNKVYVRALDSLDSRMISDAGDLGITDIFWSPDSEALGLVRTDRTIERFDLDGSAPTTLARFEVFMGMPRWGDDGYIYFTKFQSGVDRIPETGGVTESVLKPHGEMLDYHGIVVLPGGRGFLTVPHIVPDQHWGIYHETPGEEARVIYESDSEINGLEYSPTGHVLFQREQTPRGLWALPFSLERTEATGSPFLVTADLRHASVSDKGDMAYAQSSIDTGGRKQEIVWVDRTGEIVERLDMNLYDARPPAVSPDGTQLAVISKGIDRPQMEEFEVWAIDLERSSSTRLTEGGVKEYAIEWNADGSRIAFIEATVVAGAKDRVVSIRADGTGERELLFEADISFFVDLDDDWSRVALMQGGINDETGMDIYYETLGDPSSRLPVTTRPDQEVGPLIHPEGKWVAYSAGDFITMDTFVQPFPSGDGRWKMSVGRGLGTNWAPDGTRLYYDATKQGETGIRLNEVTFDGSASVPVIGKPVELFYAKDALFSVTPTADGRFVYVRNKDVPEGGTAPDTKGIVLVQKWLSRFGD